MKTAITLTDIIIDIGLSKRIRVAETKILIGFRQENLKSRRIESMESACLDDHLPAQADWDRFRIERAPSPECRPLCRLSEELDRPGLSHEISEPSIEGFLKKLEDSAAYGKFRRSVPFSRRG
jgi:hypothetical protein